MTQKIVLLQKVTQKHRVSQHEKPKNLLKNIGFSKNVVMRPTKLCQSSILFKSLFNF